MTLKQVYVRGQGQTPGLWIDDDSGSSALNADLIAKLALWDPAVNPAITIAGRNAAGDKGGGTFHAVLTAGGPAIDNAMVFATANPLWRAIRDFTDHLCPNWFGTEGDGTTNDTAALQHALDDTVTWGVPLRCDAGATYLVRYASALYNGACLVLKHGTRLDLNGATIKLDADQWCSVMLNEHVGGGGPDHVEIGNGIIDGNEANQSRHWTGAAWNTGAGPGGVALTYTPTVVMMRLDAPWITDLEIKNGYIAACVLQNVTRLYLHGLTITGCWGDGNSLAICEYPDIDDLYATLCRAIIPQPVWGSAWGQGIIWDVDHANIGSVTLVDCESASKYQGGGADAVWKSLRCVAGTLTCSHQLAPLWGMKIQGTGPVPHNEKLKINKVICDASDAAINPATQLIGGGLYLYASDDLEIDSYTGIKCGIGVSPGGFDQADWSDVLVYNCPRLKIGLLSTDHCGGIALLTRTSVGAGTATDSIDVGEIVALDPAVAAGAFILSVVNAHVHVGKIRLIENAPPVVPTTIVFMRDMVTDGSASCHIDEVIQNEPLNALMFWNLPDANVASLTVGRVRVDGVTGRSEGVQTLANGAGTTPVTAEEVSSWDALFPLLTVMPQNATAAALGNMTTVADIAPDSGFTITHGVAGAADIVTWKNLGYASLAGLATPLQWTTLVIGGGSPSARMGAMAAYMPTLDLTILHGGIDVAGTLLNDTWQFNHATRTWTQLFPATVVSVRSGGGCCYDSDRGRIVIQGGWDAGARRSDTIEYYANDWHVVASAVSGPVCACGAASMSYDAHRHLAVMYVATNGVAPGRWWTYDGVDWTNEAGALPNGVFTGVGVCYDAARQVVVAHGGDLGTGVAASDSYEWDGAALTAYANPGVPPMQDMILVYDVKRGIMVAACLSGGPAGPGIVNICWSRDGTVWTVQDTITSARVYSAGVYCPTMSEVMAFGGSTTGLAGGVLDETMVYRRG